MTGTELIVEQEEPHVSQMIAAGSKAMALIKNGGLRDILKAKSIADAAKEYLSKHVHYRDAAAAMSEISARAARRGGEILSEMDRAKPGDNQWSSHGETTTLAELGISKSQSSRWQSLAAIPEQAFEHHVKTQVAKHQPVIIKKLLALAPKVTKAKQREPEEVLDEPGNIITSLAEVAGQKFATIMADPPWNYGNQATRAATDNHYVTMSVADICAMPVADLAADDAQLHLWTTNGFLREAFEVMEAWGFSYRSVFVWCKPQMGIGNYWRVSHEFLLLGIRGSATFEDKSLKSWAELDRGKHSAKPESVRAMVETAFRGPRLELFGRIAVPGWTVFGNEVERSLYAG